jgi:hypothetical protein
VIAFKHYLRHKYRVNVLVEASQAATTVVVLIHLDFAYYSRSKHLCIVLQNQRTELLKSSFPPPTRPEKERDWGYPNPPKGPAAPWTPDTTPGQGSSLSRIDPLILHRPCESNPGLHLAAAFGPAITMPAIPVITSRTPAPKPP